MPTHNKFVVARSSLLTLRCPLFDARCWILVTLCSLLAVRLLFLLARFRYSPLAAARCPLLACRSSLTTAHNAFNCSLLVARWSPHAALGFSLLNVRSTPVAPTLCLFFLLLTARFTLLYLWPFAVYYPLLFGSLRVTGFSPITSSPSGASGCSLYNAPFLLSTACDSPLIPLPVDWFSLLSYCFSLLLACWWVLVSGSFLFASCLHPSIPNGKQWWNLTTRKTCRLVSLLLQ